MTKGSVKTIRYWLDSKRNVTRLVYGLYAICSGLLALDAVVIKHGRFGIEHIYGFYGFFGFLACVALVLVAKLLRRLLMRPENYYDR